MKDIGGKVDVKTEAGLIHDTDGELFILRQED